MINDFERTSLIQDGYFYTFVYNAIHNDKNYDSNPFVFCIEPNPKNLNT